MQRSAIEMATSVYSDPLSLQRRDAAGFVDMYSFGITMLVVLSREVNIGGIYEKAHGIFQNNNEEALKSFFKLNWSPDVI